jgi:hypothetical protein
MKPLFVAIIAALVLAPATRGLVLAGGTAAEHCAASKLKETGKKASGKLTCWSREVLKPGTYAACAAKAEFDFAKRFVQAEWKGGCVTTGDGNTIEAKVDAFVADVVAALTGAPPRSSLGTLDAQKCAGAKLRAAGKKSAGKLTCYSRAKTSGALDTHCIPKIEASYDQRWDGAEATGGCATTGDKADIEAKVDAFVSDVVAELPATTTTTTTTTTLPPCNSSSAPACNGSCPEGTVCFGFVVANTPACSCAVPPPPPVCGGTIGQCGGNCPESSDCTDFGSASSAFVGCGCLPRIKF